MARAKRPPILALRSGKTGIALSTEQNAPNHAKSNYQPNPRFFGEYCAVVPKSNPAHPIAVGITPGDAWANAKIALSLDGRQLCVGYDIIRISEEQYRAAGGKEASGTLK